MKLIIMVGLPASGKSTLAKKYAEDFDCELIKYDEFPAPVHKKKEAILAKVEEYLADGKDVIVDGVYVSKIKRSGLVNTGRKYDAEICFYIVDTTEEECIENNKERDCPIDEGFIRYASCIYEEPTEDEYDTLIRSEENE